MEHKTMNTLHQFEGEHTFAADPRDIFAHIADPHLRTEWIEGLSFDRIGSDEERRYFHYQQQRGGRAAGNFLSVSEEVLECDERSLAIRSLLSSANQPIVAEVSACIVDEHSMRYTVSVHEVSKKRSSRLLKALGGGAFALTRPRKRVGDQLGSLDAYLLEQSQLSETSVVEAA